MTDITPDPRIFQPTSGRPRSFRFIGTETRTTVVEIETWESICATCGRAFRIEVSAARSIRDKIECRCGHHGFVAASALPGVLRCCTCDHAEFFRKGCQTVRSRYTAAIDGEMWAAYEQPSKRSAKAADP